MFSSKKKAARLAALASAAKARAEAEDRARQDDILARIDAGLKSAARVPDFTERLETLEAVQKFFRRTAEYMIISKYRHNGDTYLLDDSFKATLEKKGGQIDGAIIDLLAENYDRLRQPLVREPFLKLHPNLAEVFEKTAFRVEFARAKPDTAPQAAATQEPPPASPRQMRL